MSRKDFKIMLLFSAMFASLAFAQSVTTRPEGRPGAPSKGAAVIYAAPIEVVPVDKEPAHRLVFENEYVRVFSVEVAPHSETKYHQHDRDYVGVILGDAEVESVRLGEAAVKLQLKDGETRFTKGGFAHKAVNKGDKPFRNVTVEFKKPLIGLVASAANSTIVDGHLSRTTVVFSDQVVCTQIQGVMGAIRAWIPLNPSRQYLVVAAGRGFITKAGKEKTFGSGEFDWLKHGASSDAGVIREGRGLLVCGF